MVDFQADTELGLETCSPYDFGASFVPEVLGRREVEPNLLHVKMHQEGVLHFVCIALFLCVSSLGLKRHE